MKQGVALMLRSWKSRGMLLKGDWHVGGQVVQVEGEQRFPAAKQGQRSVQQVVLHLQVVEARGR